MAATALDRALDLLQRLGVPIAVNTAQAAPCMIITEMTAADVEAIRARAEAEYRGEYGDADDHADDFAAPASHEPVAGPCDAGEASAKPEGAAAGRRLSARL